jgi:hypothetical protein
MKKLMISSIVLFTFCLSLKAQWNVYLFAGISPASYPENADLIVNRSVPLETFLFNMPHVETQYFGGLNFRHDINDYMFTSLGTTYTQRNFHYTLSYVTPRPTDTNESMAVTEHQISFAASIGARLRFIEIVSGLQANVVVARNCELTQIPGFEDHASNVEMGWHGACQVSFRRILAGVEYQADFSRLCSGMKVQGRSIELMQVSGQWIFKIQCPI